MRKAHRCSSALCLQTFRNAAYIRINKFEGAHGRVQTTKEVDPMNIARSLNNWRKYRQTITELGRMSDRELRDLGIGREDIRRVARHAVNG